MPGSLGFRFALVVAAALLLSSCATSASPAPTATPPRPTPAPFPRPPHGKNFVATLITDAGGLSDRSFNDASRLGLLEAQRHYHITPTVVPSRSAGTYLHGLVRAAQTYSTVTFAVGYSMSRAVYTASREFPRARFAIIDARPIDPSGVQVSVPNVENVFFREQESGYLVGMIAGLMEKNRVAHASHNTIGYLGGTPIPAVDHYLAGYVAGARSVDPTIKILGGYAGSFTDYNSGKRIGAQQILHGADILFQVAAQSGLGYLAAAQQNGAYGIGSDSNQSYLGSFMLTSAVKRVSVAVRTVVEQTEHNRFMPGDHVFGAAENGVGFSPPNVLVPATIVARARAALKRIASGNIVPPTTIPGK